MKLDLIKTVSSLFRLPVILPFPDPLSNIYITSSLMKAILRYGMGLRLTACQSTGSQYKLLACFLHSLPCQVASEELIQAAATGEGTKVIAILKAGAVHVDVVDRNGHSALFVAAVSCAEAL